MQETLVQSLGWGRSPGEGNGSPLQYSYQENPMDEEPGRLQSMELQSRTRLSDFTYLPSMLLLLLSRFSRVRLCATP